MVNENCFLQKTLGVLKITLLDIFLRRICFGEPLLRFTSVGSTWKYRKHHIRKSKIETHIQVSRNMCETSSCNSPCNQHYHVLRWGRHHISRPEVYRTYIPGNFWLPGGWLQVYQKQKNSLTTWRERIQLINDSLHILSHLFAENQGLMLMPI